MAMNKMLSLDDPTKFNFRNSGKETRLPLNHLVLKYRESTYKLDCPNGGESDGGVVFELAGRCCVPGSPTTKRGSHPQYVSSSPNGKRGASTIAETKF